MLVFQKYSLSKIDTSIFSIKYTPVLIKVVISMVYYVKNLAQCKKGAVEELNIINR